MMEQIKLNVFNYDSIDTRNLDMVGDSAKCRLDAQNKQIEQLKEMIEQEKQNKIKEEKEKEILQNELKKAKLDEEARKQKEIEMQKLIEQQNIRERKLREIEKYNRKISEENRRKQELIELEAKRRGIIIEELDNKINKCKKISKGSVYSLLGGIALSGGFANCEIIKDELIKKIGNISIIILSNPENSVMKGAIIYAIDQNKIKSRISSYTYKRESFNKSHI